MNKLFRSALGEVIREQRVESSLTLRQVSAKASVALGYLSEVERGQKEVSSELLECIAHGLGVRQSDLTISAGARLATDEMPKHFDIDLEVFVTS